MCCGKTFFKFCALGPLYRMDNFKGRVHWLILILGKFLLPSLFLLISERSEAEGYRWKMINFYKDKMHSHCEVYKDIHEKEYFDGDYYNDYNSDSDYSLPNIFQALSTQREQSLPKRRKTNAPHKRSTSAASNTENLVNDTASWMKDLESFIRQINTNRAYTGLWKGKREDIYRPSEVCCGKYRGIVEDRVKCLEDQGSRTSAASFSIAIFYPLIGTLFVAVLMMPLKWSKHIQGKLLLRGKRPGIENTAEEVTKDIQGCVQMVVDLIAYYFIIFKTWELSTALRACTRFPPCLPDYTSYQVTYLMVVAQTPWMSILWGFIYA